MKLLLVSLLAVSTILTASAQQSALSELVRKWGDIEGGIRGSEQPISLKALIEHSTLVARVTIVGVDSHLTSDEQMVMTEYSALVLDVEHDPDSQARLGERLVVSRYNGEIQVEGHRVLYRDARFPNFKVGEEYILFLRASAFPKTESYESRYRGLKRYDVVSDGWGTFTIGAGEVRQLSDGDTDGWNAGEPGAASVFFDELRSTVAQVRKQSPPR